MISIIEVEEVELDVKQIIKKEKKVKKKKETKKRVVGGMVYDGTKMGK